MPVQTCPLRGGSALGIDRSEIQREEKPYCDLSVGSNSGPVHCTMIAEAW